MLGGLEKSYMCFCENCRSKAITCYSLEPAVAWTTFGWFIAWILWRCFWILKASVLIHFSFCFPQKQVNEFGWTDLRVSKWSWSWNYAVAETYVAFNLEQKLVFQTFFYGGTKCWFKKYYLWQNGKACPWIFSSLSHYDKSSNKIQREYYKGKVLTKCF